MPAASRIHWPMESPTGGMFQLWAIPQSEIGVLGALVRTLSPGAI